MKDQIQMAEMSPEDGVKTAGAIVNVVADLVKVAGDDPQVKEAARNLGQTAVTVTAAINNFLLPIAVVNYSFTKARTYFETRFSKDIEKRIAVIPPEDVIEPKASIAGPALQGLAFSHEEPALRDMYLSLIAAAMDKRVASRAHPAFVEIIKQLTAIEARQLVQFVSQQQMHPIVEYRYTVADGGHRIARTHVMDARNEQTGERAEMPELPVFVDNWTRLGLIMVAYDLRMTDELAYEFATQRPEYLELTKSVPEGCTLTVAKGVIQPTQFGLEFGRAVGTSEIKMELN
ncbi:DUF4393 domain-containing protein [Variovorax sp. MHTC-1]|uniref:DUF4393 domain-containing protein n=1 Tax=Variovorax sp. MHTC-1 TaxID=2495593 RepID=UPI00163D1D8E|nr:DUF4393 domain-containing protein [Variovorax sp. MHTC-1]